MALIGEKSNWQPRLLSESTVETKATESAETQDSNKGGLTHDIERLANNNYTREPGKINTPKASGTYEEMQNGYGDKQAQADLQQAYANSREVANNYTTEAIGNAADPHYQQNQAKNSKLGNLNNKSYDDTLRLSRLADTINNSLWWTKPSDIGNGAVGTSSYTAPQLNGLEKREPIDTQEMRQMRANEQVDATARNHAADLQSKVFEMSYDAITQNRDTDNALAKQLGISNIDIYKAMRQAVIDVDYRLPAQTYYTEVLNRYNTQLEMWMLGQKANLLAWAQREAPSVIAYIAQLCATSPQALSAAHEARYTQDIINQLDLSGYSSFDQQMIYNIIQSYFTAAAGASNVRATTDVMGSLLNNKK